MFLTVQLFIHLWEQSSFVALNLLPVLLHYKACSNCTRLIIKTWCDVQSGWPWMAICLYLCVKLCTKTQLYLHLSSLNQPYDRISWWLSRSLLLRLAVLVDVAARTLTSLTSPCCFANCCSIFNRLQLQEEEVSQSQHLWFGIPPVVVSENGLLNFQVAFI